VSADDAVAASTTPATIETAHASTAPSPAVGRGRARGVNRPHGVYVVRPGDSLWSIAARLLGDAASDARMAREVNRLWQLNEHRIATGSPDLLMVGTRLRLR
jgi:nucleoid-associated protein YgaU